MKKQTHTTPSAHNKRARLPFGPWRWYYPLAAYALSIVTVTLGSILLPAGSPFGSASQVLSYGLAAFLAIGLFSLIRKKSEFAFFSLGRQALWRTTLYGVVAGVAHVVIIELLGALIPELKSSIVDDLKKMNFAPENALAAAMTVITVSVLAPVFEELFFRGMLFKAVRDGIYQLRAPSASWAQLTLAISVILSTTAFVQIHVGEDANPLTGLLYVVMPLLAIWAYVKTGNLLAPIIAHAVNNVIVLTMGLIQWGNVPAWLIVLSLCGVPLSVAVGLGIGKVLGLPVQKETARSS